MHLQLIPVRALMELKPATLVSGDDALTNGPTWPGLKYCILHFIQLIYFLKRFYLFIFRQRGREGGRQAEKHCVVAFCMPPTGDLARNPGMCPDWESNWQSFGSQAGA